MILAIKQITITFLLVAFTSQVFSNNLFKDPPTKKSKPNIIVIMADDIGETKNIANKHPKDVERLSQLSQEWDSHLIDPIFLGLIHTKEWQKKLQRKNKKN